MNEGQRGARSSDAQGTTQLSARGAAVVRAVAPRRLEPHATATRRVGDPRLAAARWSRPASTPARRASPTHPRSRHRSGERRRPVPPISSGGHCAAGAAPSTASQGASTGTMPAARAAAARAAPRASGRSCVSRRSRLAGGAGQANAAAAGRRRRIGSRRSSRRAPIQRPSQSCVSQASTHDVTAVRSDAVPGAGARPLPAPNPDRAAGSSGEPARPVARSTRPVAVSSRRPQRSAPTARDGLTRSWPASPSKRLASTSRASNPARFAHAAPMRVRILRWPRDRRGAGSTTLHEKARSTTGPPSASGPAACRIGG